MSKKMKGFSTGHDQAVGKSSFANMPSEVVMKQYPKSRPNRGGMIDDTITGVDNIMDGSERLRGKYVSNQK